MGSKREEERNEKIIRGLMKLPPNRRCINCNSLGPQYVCTNFWAFVCITCSGIHREFTHRVKSVSMAKFTSQEVEALQNGGNQRARDIYLKDWDSQRQRLPDSSNVDKIREFIKSVYVDKRYAGGKTSDKPPRDVHSHRSHEDEKRRASSYHSYSQSPPYDYQYEDRLYGKQSAVLTRKPGSDRGLYAGKISNFVDSPGRASEQMFEDRFANEGTGSRVSDYSVSSGGDPFRSGAVSPNFQKDIGFNSPPIQRPEANYQRDAHSIPRPQRTTSSGSIGSFDSNSMSLRSYNSLADISEPEQAGGAYQDNTFPRSSAPVSYGGLELFQAPVLSEPDSSAAAPIDLFQLQVTSSASVDTFQPSSISPAPSINLYQPPQTTPSSSSDFFAGIAPQPSTATLDSKSPELLNPKNEGWATFDAPQPAPSVPGTEILSPSIMPSDGGSVKLDQFSSVNASMQWPPFQNSSTPVPTSSISNQWHDGLQSVQALGIATNTQSWNAFGDSIGHLTLESVEQSSEPPVAVHKPSSTIDQNLGLNILEDSNNDGIQRAASHSGTPGPSVASHAPSILPLMGETHAADRKSNNPFDLPYDTDLEQSNMFLDMSSLQAALPNTQMPSTFLGGVAEPWFPQNPVTPYIPAPQGGLAYMAAQSPGSQLPNVPTQGPVASIGGNPFA